MTKYSVKENELVMFVSETGKCWMMKVKKGKELATHLGKVKMDDVIGKSYGSCIFTTKSHKLHVFRPALHEYALKLKRGAQIIYPKDAGAILTFGDVRKGMKVLEAGTGSGALTCFLAEAVGNDGMVVSVERRKGFMKVAMNNIERFFGALPEQLKLVVGDIKQMSFFQTFDRVVLDMLDPWNALENVTEMLAKGGMLICYLTNVPQVQKTVEKMHELETYTNIKCFEVLMREWIVDERRARPKERMVAHTGFILVARRTA